MCFTQIFRQSFRLETNLQFEIKTMFKRITHKQIMKKKLSNMKSKHNTPTHEKTLSYRTCLYFVGCQKPVRFLGTWGRRPDRGCSLGLPSEVDSLLRKHRWTSGPIWIKEWGWQKLGLKVIWSIGKGSEIFRENSHLFEFHLTAYHVCIVTWNLFT